MSKRKYSKGFKLKVLKEHGERASFYSFEKKYGITSGEVKRWNSAFVAHGKMFLLIITVIYANTQQNLNRRLFWIIYQAISFQSIAVKYGIHAESTVLKWVKQYNNHVELTDSREVGGYLMAKGIKLGETTLDEHIRIVEYCIANAIVI